MVIAAAFIKINQNAAAFIKINDIAVAFYQNQGERCGRL